MKAEFDALVKYLESLQKQNYYGKVMLTYEKGSCYNVKIIASIDVEKINEVSSEAN